MKQTKALQCLGLLAKSWTRQMAMLLMILAPVSAWAISGSGTSSSHYKIATVSDWTNSSFQTKLTNSSSSSPVYIDITGDFTVTSVMLRDKSPYIVLDGQGHTITLSSVSTTEQNTGLFGQIGGGEVKNLRIAGNMGSSEKYMGNLCGRVKNTLTVTNVLCSASVSGDMDGDATAGGLVGQIDGGTVTFNQCGFTYRLYGHSKADKMCGMVGYRSGGTVVFNNCFCKAEWVNPKSGDNYAYMRNDGSNTTYTNSYYVSYGTGGKATDKSSGGPTQIAASKFGTGELAYKLNGNSNGVARWYQNIDNGSTDGSYPFPYTTTASSHGKVYYGTYHGVTKYSNYAHTMTVHNAVAQTCTSDGTIKYWTCECNTDTCYTNSAGTATTTSLTVAKYNHIGHGKGYTATYDWTGSSYSSAQCKATLKCGNCGTTLESNKTLTVARASQTAATCTAGATRTYKATGTNSTYSFSYDNTSSTYVASGTISHVFGSNDPNKTFCTRCNHTFLYYTANAKVTPSTRYASLPGYSSSNNNYDSTTKKGVIELTEKLTTIGEGQFDYMPDLTGFTIPVSVTTIGKSAFRQSGLTGTLNIPSSVTSIGTSAFSYCSGLSTLNIPSSITTIGESTFEGCSGLTGTLDIPSSVTSIGSSAFSGCLGLSSIIIPSSVTSIGSYAFFNALGSTPSLTSVTVKTSSVLTFNFFFRETLLGKSVTLYVPSSLAAQYKAAAGWKAFGKIRCITHDITHVEAVPTTCTTNGIVEHWYCPACETYYKNAVCTEECTSAEVVEASGHKFDLATDPDCTVCTRCKHTLLRYMAYEKVEPCNNLLPGYSSENNNYDAAKKQGVIELTTTLTAIPDSAFMSRTPLYSITIPSSVTSIGGSVFRNCGSMLTVTIPDNVTSIGAEAFAHTGLSNLNLGTGLTSISNSAFYDCTSLTKVAIPSSITSIANSAFRSCTSLTEVTIPSSVTSIANNAFCFCTSLTEVTIPSSVTSIGAEAFAYCTGLSNLNLGTGLTSISNYAFYDCKSLTKVDIPSSVTSIANYAFFCCSGLTEVTVKTATVLGWESHMFDNLGKKTLFVPSNLVAEYRTADGWKDFGKIRCITHVLNANGACTFCEFIRGDINCDHYLTVSDLVNLIRLLGQEGTINCPEADVDGQNGVTLDDVDALSDIILGKSR